MTIRSTDGRETGPHLLAFSDVETAYDDPERVGRLAGAIRARGGAETLLLDAGDSTALGALAFATEEERGHARPFHESIEPDAHAPGNHDFDRGPDWLASFAEETPGRWLAANVGVETGTDGAVAFDDVAVFDVGDERVAVVGVAHPETSTFCAAADGIVFRDPVDAVRRTWAERDDVDHRVVLSHCGRLDRKIARSTESDVVVGGHDGRRTVERIEGTLVCRTRGKGRELLSVALGDEPAATVVETADAPVDEPVAETYRARLADAGLNERVGTLDRDLNRRETGGVVAEAYRRHADADAGLIFDASVRESLGGTVTVGDVVGVVPFGSTLVAVECSGDRLRELLVRTRDPIDDTHGRGIWAGANAETATVAGETPDPGRTYRIGMMSYVPRSGVVPGVDAERIAATHGPQHERVVEYVRRRETDVV